jgi:hypothetical protein
MTIQVWYLNERKGSSIKMLAVQQAKKKIRESDVMLDVRLDEKQKRLLGRQHWHQAEHLQIL